MMETLLDVYGCGTLNNQMMCLIIFRNFSFYGPGRSLISSDGNYFFNHIIVWEESNL